MHKARRPRYKVSVLKSFTPCRMHDLGPELGQMLVDLALSLTARSAHARVCAGVHSTSGLLCDLRYTEGPPGLRTRQSSPPSMHSHLSEGSRLDAVPQDVGRLEETRTPTRRRVCHARSEVEAKG